MATYVNDLRLKEITTGDESGTWGDSTNVNLELIAEAFSYATQDAFTTDANATTTIADGATDPARSLYYKVTSSATLTATRILTLAPNTVSKIWIIENATTGGQSIEISQGSGSNVTVPNGQVKVIYSDGAGATAAVVDAFTDLEVGSTFKVGSNLTVGGTYTGGGLMTTGGNIVIPNGGNIGSASDTDAIAIASSGVVTFSQIPLFSLGLGATSFNDSNITNVGDIALDSISSDAGTTISVTLGTDAGDNFIVGNNNALVVEGDTDRVGIGTATPSVSLDVGSNTDAVLLPVGTTAERPTGAQGQLRYNTTLARFEGYTTEWGAIGGGTSTNTFTTDIFSPNGSTTNFTLSQVIADENNLMVYIDGVFQAQDSYTVSGTTLTLDAAPASGTVLTVYSVAGAVAGSNFGIATMTGDGSDTTLTLPYNPVNENNVQVYIDGVYQNKDTFSVSGTTLTFSEAPPNGTAVEAMVVSQTSVNTATILKDADEDTKVEVEQNADEDKIRFTTAGTERAIIDNSGNVGIGTTSPSSELHVKAASGFSEIYFQGASSTSGSYLFDNGTESGIYKVDSGYMAFGTGNTERMRIDASGNVGIGTSSPASGVGSPLTLTSTSTGYVGLRLNGTGSYANDWDLYASGDGAGLDYFGIYDRTNTTYRMVVTNTGNVGIGTSSPATKLHVTGTVGAFHSNNDNRILMYNNGTVGSINVTYGTTGPYLPLTFLTSDTERMRINTNGTVGIGSGSRTDQILMVQSAAPQIELINTSNSYGSLTFVNNSLTSSSNDIASIGAEIDSGNAKGRIVFKTRNTDGSGSQAERMRITSNGEFLLNRSSIFGAGNTCSAFIEGKSTAAMYVIGTNTSGYQLITFFNGGLNVMGSITHNNTGVTYGTSSDYRLKENVVEMDGAIDRVKLLQPKRFNFIADAENTVDGFLAHEVADVVPEAITGIKDEVDNEGNPKYQNIDQSKLVPLLTKAIQEQQVLIEQLQAEVALLKGE